MYNVKMLKPHPNTVTWDNNAKKLLYLIWNIVMLLKPIYFFPIKLYIKLKLSVSPKRKYTLLSSSVLKSEGGTHTPYFSSSPAFEYLAL